MDEQSLAALEATQVVQQAKDAGLNPSLLATWDAAPTIGGLKTIIDVPAMAINVFVTALVYIGIRESKRASNAMVILKVAVVLVVIAVGVFYVKPANWSPFAPNGVSGVLQGIAAVFFAFIGFDAISTTAEECKNPQRDLPRATVLVLIVCTVLYVAISLVLTGMVSYTELAVADPLAFVFEKYNLDWLAGLVSLSAIVAITSVFLVFQIGQPRDLDEHVARWLVAEKIREHSSQVSNTSVLDSGHRLSGRATDSVLESTIGDGLVQYWNAVRFHAGLGGRIDFGHQANSWRRDFVSCPVHRWTLDCAGHLGDLHRRNVRLVAIELRFLSTGEPQCVAELDVRKTTLHRVLFVADCDGCAHVRLALVADTRLRSAQQLVLDRWPWTSQLGTLLGLAGHWLGDLFQLWILA